MQILLYTLEMSLRPTIYQLQMPACTGIRQSLQQNPEIFLGPVCLETMMMHHLNGRWSGFQPLEFLHLFAQQSTRHIQVSMLYEMWCKKAGDKPVITSDRQHSLGLSVFPRIMIDLSLFWTAASLELGLL